MKLALAIVAASLLLLAIACSALAIFLYRELEQQWRIQRTRLHLRREQRAMEKTLNWHRYAKEREQRAWRRGW